MATDPSGDLTLAPLTGEPHTLREWLTTFHLVVVALDPYTHQSAWLLETAGRILEVFDQADCRVAWLVTGNEDQTRQFLGPWSEEILTFTDADRTVVQAFGLEELPAFVHIDQHLNVIGAAEGWDPDEWRDVATELADVMSWTRPTIPGPGDPTPYRGTPALG